MIDPRIPATAALMMLLAGCGQTGPLYLPGDDDPEQTLDAEQETELFEESEGTPQEDETPSSPPEDE